MRRMVQRDFDRGLKYGERCEWFGGEVYSVRWRNEGLLCWEVGEGVDRDRLASFYAAVHYNVFDVLWSAPMAVWLGDLNVGAGLQ